MAKQNPKRDEKVWDRPGNESQNDKLREMRPYKWARKKGESRIQRTPKPKS